METTPMPTGKHSLSKFTITMENILPKFAELGWSSGFSQRVLCFKVTML